MATYDRVSCRAVSYGACVGSTRSVIGALGGDRRQRPNLVLRRLAAARKKGGASRRPPLLRVTR